ncbi:Na(+)/H(+) antiporter NhaA [Polaribacter huanghezhanensis]|nr:Na(+)/H(+) antiporter NhaA [Polaribacter huanghezhanensis]
MSIFFFLIGLELKRELLIGEINNLKKAAFPFITVLGSVLVPIALYLFLNQNPENIKGWRILGYLILRFTKSKKANKTNY